MTVAYARTSAYFQSRLIRGRTSRRTCWIADQRSTKTSPITRSSVRATPYGLAK